MGFTGFGVATGLVTGLIAGLTGLIAGFTGLIAGFTGLLAGRTGPVGLAGLLTGLTRLGLLSLSLIRFPPNLLPPGVNLSTSPPTRLYPYLHSTGYSLLQQLRSDYLLYW